MSDDMRLDELARAAGVPSTTVRLYQNKGLLPGPRLVGRTGFYDASHLARLQLIARLQEQGFSLAAIGRLLEAWQAGRRDLNELIGVETEFGDVLSAGGRSLVLDAPELAGRLGPGVVTADTVRRSIELGLIEPLDDGRFRVPDERFLDSGAALVRLGLPTDVILDQWEQLTDDAGDIAARFVTLFEDHLLPAEGVTAKPDDLAGTLRELRRLAGTIVAAALDAAIAREATARLESLVLGSSEAPVESFVTGDGNAESGSAGNRRSPTPRRASR